MNNNKHASMRQQLPMKKSERYSKQQHMPQVSDDNEYNMGSPERINIQNADHPSKSHRPISPSALHSRVSPDLNTSAVIKPSYNTSKPLLQEIPMVPKASQQKQNPGMMRSNSQLTGISHQPKIKILRNSTNAPLLNQYQILKHSLQLSNS